MICPEIRTVNSKTRLKLKIWIGLTVGKLFTNKETSGFTSNTLLISKQDLLMVDIVCRFNKNKKQFFYIHLMPP